MKWENGRMGEEPHPERIDEGIGRPHAKLPKSRILKCWKKTISKSCFSAASITMAFDGKLPTRPNAIRKILIVRPGRCPREALILFARGEGTKIIRRRKEGGFRIS